MKLWMNLIKCLKTKIRLSSLFGVFILISVSSSSMVNTRGVGCVLSDPYPITTEYNINNKKIYLGNNLFDFKKKKTFYIFSLTNIKEIDDRTTLRMILRGGINRMDKYNRLYGSVGFRLGDLYYVENTVSTTSRFCIAVGGRL